MNYITAFLGAFVLLVVGLTSIGIFKAFKAFMGALDNFTERYVPQKDSITFEITREWVEDFAEEFGYVVKDYDQLMKIIRKNLMSSGFKSSALPNHSAGGFFTDIMVQMFSIAVEERVVFNTLENTFATMLKENGNGEECSETDTVFEKAEPPIKSDKIINCVDHLTQNKVKAENGDGVDKKMLLRRG